MWFGPSDPGTKREFLRCPQPHWTANRIRTKQSQQPFHLGSTRRRTCPACLACCRVVIYVEAPQTKGSSFVRALSASTNGVTARPHRKRAASVSRCCRSRAACALASLLASPHRSVMSRYQKHEAPTAMRDARCTMHARIHSVRCIHLRRTSLPDPSR